MNMLRIIIFSFRLFVLGMCIHDNTIFNEKLFNLALEQQNPSSNWPPRADEGSQQPFKYPFAIAHRNRYTGGGNRGLTAHDLPISKKMASFQSRLDPAGIREMHWHIVSEWAYVIFGKSRVNVVDQDGRCFVDDVEPGDIWLFPPGVAHSIQSISSQGGFNLLVLDDGYYSRSNGSFLLTRWLNHIPKEVLAKNFQVHPDTFANLPKETLQFFKGQLPRSLEFDRKQAAEGTGCVPHPFTFHSSKMKPNITRDGGNVKIIDRRNFPATTMAAAIVTLHPGAMRELHWHPNDDEWQYYVTGKARMGVFNAGSEARTMDFQAGDVGYIERAKPHYIENTGSEDVLFLEVFATPFYEDISLAEWLAHTPVVLANEHIRTGFQFIESINKTKAVIVP